MKVSLYSRTRRTGFTLIEVTISLAIVAVGLLSIIGAYASIQKHSGDTQVRVDGTLAVNSIRNYLQWEQGFDGVYDDIRDDTLELIFFTYRGELSNQPDLQAEGLYSFTGPMESNWRDYEPARDGQMYIARLSFDENTNQLEKSELPVDSTAYDQVWVALRLSLYDIYDGSLAEALPESARPVLTSTIIVSR